jgi:succinate dehydrogenase / fumarate reductase membrane anchor subunit
VVTAKTAVGAHYGLRDWLSQRITAVVITLYTALLIGLFVWHGGVDYAGWRAAFDNGAFRVATFLFLVAVYYHAWVGVRNLSMDYVKRTGVRLILYVLWIVAPLIYCVLAVQIRRG